MAAQLTKIAKSVFACVFVAFAAGAVLLGIGPQAESADEAKNVRTSAPLPRAHRCATTVSNESAARSAVQAASGGEVVCLAAGSYGIVDLKRIDKPINNRVTFRGVGERATTISALTWAGSSGLVIENLRSTGSVSGIHQYSADHITFRHMDVSSSEDCFRGIGADEDGGQTNIIIERNFIHDCEEYAIRAQGRTPGWIVRNNRFERITEDYIQSGDPTNWVVDHNVIGPGDFNRPAGYGGHPDIWQTLDSGEHIAFTNNLVQDTNESLGFIFGTCCGGDFSGFRDVTVTNNVFARTVYGVGETCQFSAGNDFVFEQNTLVDAQGCRWGSAPGAPWPDASNLSIKRNILSGDSSLSCNDTPETNTCDAFNAGQTHNVRNFTNWEETTYYTPKGLPGNVGARLSAQDFDGYPFPAVCQNKRATITGTNGNDRLNGTKGRDVIDGAGGNDKVKAGGSKDIICGGSGNDKLKGQGGKDKLWGEGGKDNLAGGGGRDNCDGGAGKDEVACERTAR